MVFENGRRGWEMVFWNEKTGKIENVIALENNYKQLISNNAGTMQ